MLVDAHPVPIPPFVRRPTMPQLPTPQELDELESRQDELLRQLAELEQRLLAALKDCGEQPAADAPPVPAPAPLRRAAA